MQKNQNPEKNCAKSKYLKKLEVIERNHNIEVIYDDNKK